MESKRKGFTIVELVIVIAVIAILAAVLIPTFSNIIKSAQESADTQLVKNLNTAVAIGLAEDGKTQYSTAYDTIKACEESGFNIAKIVSKSDFDIAWSKDTGMFVLIDTEKGEAVFPTTNGSEEITVTGKEVDYFIIRDEMPEEGNETKYSVYAGYKWNAKEVAINAVGFDAGEADITSVSYTNNANDATAKNVVIRTNSDKTKLSITVYEEGTAGSSDYKCDNVKVYGLTGELNVVNGGQASVHTYGNVGFATVTKGKLVAEEGKVQAAYIPDSSATIEVKENGGDITIVYVKVEDDKTAVVSGSKTNVDADDVKWIYADAAVASADTKGTKVTEKAKEASLTAGNDLVLQENANFVARVNTTGYELIDDAVAACKSGDTIYLLADKTYTNNTYFYIGDRDFKINLSGCTIKNISPDLKWSSSALIVDYAYDSYITNGTFISINGSGIYAADGNTCVIEDCICTTSTNIDNPYVAAVRASECSNVTINSGTYTGYHAVNLESSGATVTINGGTFNGDLYFENVNSVDAYLYINGGTFNGGLSGQSGTKVHISITGGTFNWNPSDYVAEGYTATESDGVWTVAAN